MKPKKHTFAICAYKESPHLETCIQSVVKQNAYSNIIMCTSTPSDFLSNLANTYDIPLFIREGKSDIQDDWNFCCEKAQTEWVTVTHQDDIYDENYAKELLLEISKEPNAIMAFTDYLPIKNGRIGTDLNSRMKRLFRTPMRFKVLRHNKFFKKYFQGFGNAISCPSVAYNKTLINGKVFTSPLKFALDWDTFVKFAGYNEPFIYIHKKLFYYRIHEEATSKSFTENNIRVNDEMYMFRQFWPNWLIKIGFKLYQRSYKTYD
ncbi:glycosyltransferase family A protein [Streptococcus sp. S784/96/1]|uniref:glycosyltransferase family A protein n=1 Tax=Streptococcus sp. S784/96/1 TaxID=2653499 RepID=UPI00138A28BB|nr:glycosyltransferase family 2 protein [Streptococcus sp. S784/96/1]